MANRNEIEDWTIEKHKGDDCFVFHSEVDDEKQGRLSLTCTYIESPEAVDRKELKQIRFWMYKDEAAELANIILRVASSGSAEGDHPTQEFH